MFRGQLSQINQPSAKAHSQSTFEECAKLAVYLDHFAFHLTSSRLDQILKAMSGEG